MSDDSVATAKTHACKVSKSNQLESQSQLELELELESLTMWQTLSTPFASLTMLPAALTHTSAGLQGCKCQPGRRIWSKQRPNISGNNAEVQSHSPHSQRGQRGQRSSLSKIHSAGNPNPTRTATAAATAVTATRRCRYSSRSSLYGNGNGNWNGSSILHSLLLLCILCGKYDNKYEKREQAGAAPAPASAPAPHCIQ